MTQVSIARQHESNTTALGGNPAYSGVAWHSTHDAEYKLYVYNVSSRTFPNLGKLARAIPGVIESDSDIVAEDKEGNELGELKNNQKYHYVTSFPQPVLIAKPNIESGEIDWVELDVRRYVVDLINPDNMGLTLDTHIPDTARFSIGNDLSQKGVFFSYSNPPLREDVEKAIARMEKYYTVLLEEAGTLELTDKVKLSERLAGNPDYAYAADYFGKEVSWRKKQVRPVECLNCGENKPAGRKFHQTSFGVLCIEPTVEGWKAAVNSGVKRYEDVPEDFQWKAKAVVPTPPAPAKN